MVQEAGWEPRVVEENLFEATLWRSIECHLNIPSDALGLYDITVTCGDVDGYVMDKVLNVVKIEYIDKDGNPLDFLFVESGAVLEQIRVGGGAYDGKQLKVRITDVTTDETSLTVTLQSLDGENDLSVKDSREVTLTSTGENAFTSAPIILYDHIDPDTKTYFENQGYIMMPASWLKVLFRRAVEWVKSVTGLHLDVNGNKNTSDLVDGASQYLPGYSGNTVILCEGDTFNSPQYVGQEMKLVLMGVGTWSDIDEVIFRITETTAYPGFCMNATDPKVDGAGKHDDYSFEELQNSQEKSGTMEVHNTWVTFWCKDFGGQCKVDVVVRKGGATVFTLPAISIPTDLDDDDIADKWEADEIGKTQQDGTIKGGIWAGQYGQDEDDARRTLLGLSSFDCKWTPSDLEPKDTRAYTDSAQAPHKEIGDGISLWEEYRGYILDGGWNGGTFHQGGYGRLSPVSKELLVEVDAMAGVTNITGRSSVAVWMNFVSLGMAKKDHGTGIRLYYVIDQMDCPHDLFATNANEDDSASLRDYAEQYVNNELWGFVYVIFADEVTDPSPKSYSESLGVTVSNRGSYVWVDMIKAASVEKGYEFRQGVISIAAHEITHKIIDDPGTDGKEHFNDPDGDEMLDTLSDKFFLMYSVPTTANIARTWWGAVVRQLIDLPGKELH